MVFERSPPHLFLYLSFIQKKNNTNKDSASFGSPGSQTLLVPLGVELLNDLCAAVNPAFDSRIFFMVRRVFLLGAAEVGGLKAPVIFTSDSLPTEESEDNSISSSIGWRNSAGTAVSLPGSPSGRGAGDQYSKTLTYRRPELLYNPTGVLRKIEQKQRK